MSFGYREMNSLRPQIVITVPESLSILQPTQVHVVSEDVGASDVKQSVPMSLNMLEWKSVLTTHVKVSE